MADLTRREGRRLDPIIEALANVRKARGLGQRDLAKQMIVSQGSISTWESGKGGLTLWSLRRWVDALGYDLTITPRGDAS